MAETIDALKFWTCVVADAYGPAINQDDFVNRVIDGLKATGIKICPTTYDAICHLYRATMENRQWLNSNDS